MSFAFMPLYTGDYQRDTQHLDCCEHGVYLKLLMHCWDQKGPAPLDERRLCGIVNARSGSEIEALRRVLSEYFVKMEDGFYNPRMDREIARANIISKSRSAAGRNGYKSLKNKMRVAIAQQVPNTCPASAPTPTPTTTTTKDLNNDPKKQDHYFCPEPSQKGAKAPAPAIIRLPTNRTGEEFPIVQAKVNEWQETYPGVDVLLTLSEIRQWLRDNPARRKTSQGMLRFVNAWMRREQDRPEPVEGGRYGKA